MSCASLTAADDMDGDPRCASSPARACAGPVVGAGRTGLFEMPSFEPPQRNESHADEQQYQADPARLTAFGDAVERKPQADRRQDYTLAQIRPDDPLAHRDCLLIDLWRDARRGRSGGQRICRLRWR